MTGKAVRLALAAAVLPSDEVTVSYTVPSGVGAQPVRDALGNAAAALTDRSVPNDTARPTVAVASDATFPTRDAFTVTLTFSEAVTGFELGDVAVANGTATAFTETTTGTVWTVTVTPDSDYAGDVEVSVAADAARNASAVGNAASSEAFAVDTQAPGVERLSVTGNGLVLTYDEDLDTGSVPGPGAYVVKAGPSGSLVAVSLATTDPVTVTGKAVRLALAAAGVAER